MELAGKLIAKLGIPADIVNAEELARAAWPLAVGRKIARHAHPIKMVRTRLVVEVEDVSWQKPLFTLRRQILAKLDERIGRGLVEEVEFRVAPQRRGPQRAQTITVRKAGTDEAEGIVDPVLRNIYRHSRKKALA